MLLVACIILFYYGCTLQFSAMHLIMSLNNLDWKQDIDLKLWHACKLWDRIVSRWVSVLDKALVIMCLCMCLWISVCLGITAQSAQCLTLLFFHLRYPLQFLFSFSSYPFITTYVSFFLVPSSLHPYYYPVLCSSLCYHRNASVSLLAWSIKSLKDSLHSFISFSISMSSSI